MVKLGDNCADFAYVVPGNDSTGALFADSLVGYCFFFGMQFKIKIKIKIKSKSKQNQKKKSSNQIPFFLKKKKNQKNSKIENATKTRL